jgi:hypothetical protein
VHYVILDGKLAEILKDSGMIKTDGDKDKSNICAASFVGDGPHSVVVKGDEHPTATITVRGMIV